MEQRTLRTITTRGRAVAEFAALATLFGLLVSAILALAVAIVPAAEPAVPVVPPAAAPAAPPDSATAAAAAAAAPDTFAVTADTNLVFQLEIGNRMYPDWKETQEVHLNQEFPIGDTENSGKVVRFLPSFLIDNGKPRSMSAAMDNPAVRVLVYFKGAPKDSAWAFLNFPPHFSPKSFYTFQLKSISGYASATPAASAAGKAAPGLASPEAPPGKEKPTPKPPSGGAK